MGAKIGRRIYWPASGIYCSDPELLNVGDDVVFGTSPEFFTADQIGSAEITIGNGGEYNVIKISQADHSGVFSQL